MGNAPSAYIFDVFGTLVNWRESVAQFSQKWLEPKGISIDSYGFADYWRGQYVPAMAKIRAGNRGYVALDQLHFENLATTLDHFNIAQAFDESERWELNRVWEHLDPWPDVVVGLTALKEKAIIAPCSNGSIALMTRLAKHGGLPWDCILGADIAQNYKPEPAVYHACCKALRLPVEDVMMVAAHNDDLYAARKEGLQTAFIARPTEHGKNQKNDLYPTENWDRVIQNISELASR